MELMLTLLAAVFIGLALGLFGSGGSILTVPVLLYLLHLPEKLAIATALGIVALISAVALQPYLWRGHLHWPLLAQLALPGMLGAWAGSYASQFLDGRWQLLLLAVLMVLSAINMWRQQLWNFPLQHLWQLLLAGTLLGGLTGLIGVGGGFLIVPLLLAFTRLTVQSAIGCSLALIVLQSSSGFISHYWQLQQQGQQIDLKLIAMIGGVGALGSLFALVVSGKLPQLLLRRGFALLLVLLGLLISVRSLLSA
jgi:uncharacterized membrane protein YfcA